MKLTGKEKEDFLYFSRVNYGYYEHYIVNLPTTLQHALIIEWFDSIKCVGFKSLWSYAFGNSYDPFSDNWNEYIEKSIEHANLIYNGV